MPSRLPRLASTYPTALSLKCSMILSPGTCLGQYRLFFTRAWANTPTFASSTSACKTQKPLSRTNNLPVPWTGLVRRIRVPAVLPKLSYSLSPACGGWSFPSCRSTCHKMSDHSIQHHDIHFQMPRVSVAQT